MNTFVRRTLIFAFVMVLLAVAGWAGRKAYRKSMERRWVGEAVALLEKKDLRNASLCLQRALQINPFSARATELTADMLESAGAPAAVNWRIRTAQMETNRVEYRFAWSRTALRFGDSRSALQALSGVEVPSRANPEFHKLAGAFAWSMNDAIGAEKHYVEALRLEPTNQATVLNLATIRIGSTNPAVVEASRHTLEQVATNSPLRPIALRYLAKEAVGQQHLDRALQYSRELNAHPGAAATDRISHLHLLHEMKSPEFVSWRSELETQSRQSPEPAFELGRWVEAVEAPAQALRWLQSLPSAIQTNYALVLVAADCRIRLKDWTGLLGAVDRNDWGQANFYRLALLSLAERNLGHAVPARGAWQKSMHLAAGQLDRLSQLAQLTSGWGWQAEQSEVLQQIVTRFPREKWAADQLVDSLYSTGNTVGLADVLGRVYSADPSDNKRKNNLAAVFLLRKSNLENAHRMAQETYQSDPNNPFYLCTYAYSLLLQNRTQEAAKLITGLKTDNLKIPSIAAYYGVVLAQAGHSDAAREPLRLAQTGQLLPEEKELVRQAMTRL